MPTAKQQTLCNTQMKLILAESKFLRWCCFFTFYLTQGLPIGLWTVAIPSWLASNDASAIQIGQFIGVAMAPWAFSRLFNGTVLDRFAYLPMGRRRAWLVGAQLVSLLGVCSLAIIKPGVEELGIITVVAVLVNFSLTVQDAAVDGLAVDLTPQDQLARTTGIMFAGQIFGTVVGAAAGSALLESGGLKVAALSFSIPFLFVLALTIMIRERAGERLLPWTEGTASTEAILFQQTAWLPIVILLGKSFLNPQIILFTVGYMITGLAVACIDVGGPIFAISILSWSESRYGALAASAGILSGALCLFVVGVLGDRFGKKLILFVCLVLGCFISIAMALLRDYWLVPGVFEFFIVGIYVLSMSAAVCLTAIAMSLCLPKVAASQFGVIVTLPNMTRLIAATQIGAIVANQGFEVTWGIMGAAFVLSTAPLYLAYCFRKQ